MKLHFDRTGELLTLIGSNGAKISQFPAANFVDSHSKGVWPNGVYAFVTMFPAVRGDDADSAYGETPRLLFDVPDREGMEIHAGRANEPDGLGRSSYRHCTMGCIRTIASAILAIISVHGDDPLTTLTVSDTAWAVGISDGA